MSQVDTYISNLPGLTDAELKKEKATVSGLLTKAIKDGKPRRSANLEKMLAGVITEAQRRGAVSNPGESIVDSYPGKLARLTDDGLRAEHKKLTKMLKESKAPVRHFGTEGLSILKQMIKAAEKEMKGRGMKANPEGKPKRVRSLAAFKKLSPGTPVTVHDRTGYVVMHRTSKGLYAAPTDMFERSQKAGYDPLESGARYFFDEDLEEFFRGGKQNPKKKKKKKGMSTAGRAAVGAGVGALALGPIGAVGLGYAATKYKPVKAKQNPLKKIPKGAKRAQIQKIISHNIAMEMEAGKPQKQAVAIAIAEARRQSPMAARMYPERNPVKKGEMYKDHRVVFEGSWDYKVYKGTKKVHEGSGFSRLLGAAKDAKAWIDGQEKKKNPDSPRYRVHVQGNYFSVETGEQPVKRVLVIDAKSKDEARKKAASRMTEMAREIGYDFEGQHRKFTAEKVNPKGKSSRKKKATKKRRKKATKTSPAKALVSKARKLWDHYVERPSKKRLKDVFEHLGRMELSAAKSVKDELRRAKRVAKAEAKRLKMKV